MVKVKVFSKIKSREEWLNLAIAEYEKRLQAKMSIEWVFFKDDSALIEKASKENYIALDPNGKLLSSEDLSKTFFKWGSKPTFIIGGADGIPEIILKNARFIWSLSPLTFTHQMTRLILLEQLYRATEIEKGSSYHRSERPGSKTLRHS